MKHLICTLLLMTFTLTGCFGGRKPEVNEGADLRKRAYVNVSESKDQIIATIAAGYRDAEYARIDLEIERALEADYAQVRKNANAFGGSIPVEQAIEGTKKLIAVREKERTEARAKVDAALVEMQAIITRANTDLLIANKLNDALEEYDRAGIDVSAATKAVEEIMALAAKNKPKPGK